MASSTQSANKTEQLIQFQEMGLDDRVLEAIARLQWVEPTLIQEKVIPFFLRGRDIVAVAGTGSGKTGAFAVPLVHKILERKASITDQITSALILAPTKELCNQIAQNIRDLTRLCSREVKCLSLCESESSEDALIGQLADTPDIVVGTPLRVCSQLNEENNSEFMSSLQYLIVDEADLMLACENEVSLDTVLKCLPNVRPQSVLVSTSLPKDIKDLQKHMMHKPVILKLEEPPLPPVSRFTQYVMKLEENEKVIFLCSLLQMKLINGKILLFVNSVEKGYRIKMFLGAFGINCEVLNSELPSNLRCRVVHDFNKGNYKVLVAADERTVTDPLTIKEPKFKKLKKDPEAGVSRGIDFHLVSMVFNFDFPTKTSTYVHRVGRTARGGTQGTALSLVATYEQKSFRKIDRNLRELMPDGKSVFQNYKFNMSLLEGFRLRATEAWNQCTKVAVRNQRRKEIQEAIINSQKLKSFFEDHPRDFEALQRIDTTPVISQPHLLYVPDYNVPTVLKRVAVSSRKSRMADKKNVPYKMSKKSLRRMNKSDDPLRSMVFNVSLNK